jgi:SAM-dependent methyltransferase
MPNFYRAFEDRFRGSRELIKERLKVYQPFLAPLHSIYSDNAALDLGCGRGEWLELLQECGFQAQGVDLDDEMLEACFALDLSVEQCDALLKLKAQPDESLSIVSGFHIVEHIPFADLHVWVAEALRVLKPAGLLILETPNSENIVVGTSSFYLDPTHERPIPHLLLGFLTEYAGFARSKLLRLQESPKLREASNIALMQVLGGSSPDYGIVAQKSADEQATALFTPAFSKDYGLALGVLAERYEQGLKSRFKELESRVEKTAEVCGTLSMYIAHLQGEPTSQIEGNSAAISHCEKSGSENATLSMLQARNGGSSLDLDLLREETAAHRLRLHLQEALHRLSSAESRYQTSEQALHDQLARAAQAEGKLASAQTSIEALQTQLQQVTCEILNVYKVQQALNSAVEQERHQAIAKQEHSLQLLDAEAQKNNQLRQESILLQQQISEQKCEILNVYKVQQALNSAVEQERHQAIAKQEHSLQLLDAEAQKNNQLLQESVLLQQQISEQQVAIISLVRERDSARSDLSSLSLVITRLQSEADQHLASFSALKLRLAEVEGRFNATSIQLREILTHNDTLNRQLKTAQGELRDSVVNAEHLRLSNTAQQARISALMNSSSWRITAPVRFFNIAARWVVMQPFRLVRATARLFGSKLIAGVLSSSIASGTSNFILRKHPKLHAHLRAFAVNQDVLAVGPEAKGIPDPAIADNAGPLSDLPIDVGLVEIVASEAMGSVNVHQQVAHNIDLNDASHVSLFDDVFKKNGTDARTAIVYAHKKAVHDSSEK